MFLMHPLSLALLLLWPLGCVHAQSTDPPPRRRGASVQWSNKWYIQGGFSSDFLDSFYSLDLSTNWSTASPPWTTLTSGSLGSHFGMVATRDGRIWTVGGSPRPRLLSAYSSNGQWTELPNTVPLFPQGIEGHAALVVPNDDKIYIVGGFSNTTGVPGASLAVTPNLITVFDTTTNSFVPPGPTAAQVGTTSWNDMGWAWLSKKQVALFFGGTRSLPGSNIVPMGALQQFVPWRNEWSTMTTMGTGPSPRLDHCMAANADGTKVVVFGGTDGTNYLSDIFILDTESGQWTQGPLAAQPRTRMVCTIHSNQLIAWGGSYGSKAPDTLHNGTPIIFNLNTSSWVTTFTPSTADNEPGAGHDITKDLPKPPSYDPSKESSVPLGAIIGGVVGGVLLLALVGFLLYRRSRRRREDVSSTKTNNSNLKPTGPNDHYEPPVDTGSQMSPAAGTTPLYPNYYQQAHHQHQHPYQHHPPAAHDHDRFAYEGAPSPSSNNNGSLGGGSQALYGSETNNSYRHYYNAAGLAAAGAATSVSGRGESTPQHDREPGVSTQMYNNSPYTPSTATTPHTMLSPMATNTGSNSSTPSSTPWGHHQAAIDPPHINRTTRPTATPLLASADTAPKAAEVPGAASALVSTDVTVGDSRPLSMTSNSSGVSNRSAPQYVPPGPSRHSQMFGSPQDYGQQATSTFPRRQQGSEQPKAWGGVDGTYRGHSPNFQGPSHFRKHPQETATGALASDYIPPPPTQNKHWGGL